MTVLPTTKISNGFLRDPNYALVTTGGQGISVAAYGATADGMTDDTTAIQNAINAINAAGGGTLFFPRGTYLVTNLTPKSKVSYVGESGATIKATTGQANPLFYRPFSATGAFEDVTFQGLHFQGDAAAVSGSSKNAIYLHADPSAGTVNKNIRVLDCTFDDFYGSAIHIGECQHLIIRGNVTRNCIHDGNSQNAINVVVGTGKTGASTFGNIVIEGNSVIDAVGGTGNGAGIAIVIQEADFFGRATITGNVVRGVTKWAGIVCEANGTHHSVTIAGNTVTDSLIGIEVANTNVATVPTYASFRNFTITGNNVDSELTGSNGIHSEASNSTIVGNTVRVTGRAINLGGSTASARATNQLIASNTLISCNTGTATYLVFGNYGDNVTFSGNRLSADSGAVFRGPSLTDMIGLHLTGNHIDTSNRDGFLLVDCQDAVIADNVVLDCGTTASNTYSGINHSGNVGNGMAIRNNVLWDRRGGSAKMKHGVSVAVGTSTGTPVRLVGNTILGFVTSSVNGRALVTIDVNNIVDTKGSSYYDDFNGQVGVYAPSCRGWAEAAVSMSSNRLVAARFVPRRDILVAKLGFSVAVAAGADDSCSVGIFDSLGTTLLASSVSTAGKLNATGSKTIDLQASYQMKANTVYYVVLKGETLGGTAAQVIQAGFGNAFGPRMFGTSLGTVEGGIIDVGATAMPSTISTLSSSAATVACLAVRES